MTLGERLRRARLERGLTQRELAHPRYTAAHVSTIESGRRHPSADALRYFAERLDISVEELSTGRRPDLIPSLDLALVEARHDASAGRIDRAMRRYSQCARQARRYRLRDVEARAELGLALCDLRSGDAVAALAHTRNAEKLLEEEAITARVDAIAAKAVCLRRVGELRHAIFVLESAREALVRTNLPDPVALFKVNVCLVGPYFESGARELAARAAESALDLAPQCDDPDRLARMHMSVARTFLERGDFDRARESLKSAEMLFRQADLHLEIGQSHLAQGYASIQQGNLAEARQHLQRACRIFRETASPLDEARALNEMARLEHRCDNPDEAEELLERSLAILGKDVDMSVAGTAYRELGSVVAISDPERGEGYLRNAIDAYERAGCRFEQAMTYRVLGDLRYERGDIAGACREYRAGMALLDEARSFVSREPEALEVDA